MPIFISRFSNNRGLVGLLQSLRARGQEAQTTQPASPANDTRQNEQAQNVQASSQSPANQSEGKAQAGDEQASTDVRDGLSAVGNTGLALTLDIARTETASAANVQEGPGASPVSTDQEPSSATIPVVETQDGAVQPQTVQKDEAPSGRTDQTGQNGGPRTATPVEVQRERLQAASHEIGSGLRQDAGLQSRLNVEEISRSTARAAEAQQRREVRQRQEETRDLQAERRQLQGEIQKTEQQIRQLQGRASNTDTTAAAKTVNTLVAGHHIDILAQ